MRKVGADGRLFQRSFWIERNASSGYLEDCHSFDSPEFDFGFDLLE
jgi:hypothetical protein